MFYFSFIVFENSRLGNWWEPKDCNSDICMRRELAIIDQYVHCTFCKALSHELQAAKCEAVGCNRRISINSKYELNF